MGKDSNLKRPRDVKAAGIPDRIEVALILLFVAASVGLLLTHQRLSLARPTVAAESTEVTGFEFEGTFAVTDNFQVGGNIGFYDAEFGPGSTVGAIFDPITGVIIPSGEDISGERPNNSPEQTWALWGSYVFDLAGGSRTGSSVSHSPVGICARR